jgi:hypothetical protein
MPKALVNRDMLIAAAIGGVLGLAIAGFSGLWMGGLNGATLYCNLTGIVYLLQGKPMTDWVGNDPRWGRTVALCLVLSLLLMAITAWSIQSGSVSMRRYQVSQASDPGEFWLVILLQMNMTFMLLLGGFLTWRSR